MQQNLEKSNYEENSSAEEKVILEKLLKKIYGVAVTKIWLGERPALRPKHVKHMLSTIRVQPSLWFQYVKKLEEVGCLELRSNNYIVVKLPLRVLKFGFDYLELQTKHHKKI